MASQRTRTAHSSRSRLAGGGNGLQTGELDAMFGTRFDPRARRCEHAVARSRRAAPLA